MGLLSKKRVVNLSTYGLTLYDINEAFEQENFFAGEASFFIWGTQDENRVVYYVPRDKITPTQLHSCRLVSEHHQLIIESKYKTLFFPGLIMLFMPLSVLVFGFNNLDTEGLKVIFYMTIGILAFNSIFAFTSLQNASKEIERAIHIRVNYLRRNQQI